MFAATLGIMFQGFTGWHALILLFVLALIFAAVIVGIVFLVRASSRSAAAAPVFETATTPLGAAAASPAATDRLAQLEQLRASGQISDPEYEAKRAQILGEL